VMTVFAKQAKLKIEKLERYLFYSYGCLFGVCDNSHNTD